LNDQEHVQKAKLLTLAVMERQMLEGYALCGALLEVKGLSHETVIYMYTLIHNLHFYLMIKYIPKDDWPEKLLLIDVNHGTH
tara:strand:+ start:299 stop:544 length:246 start_codon:yes stop_codon:yes gene_type:complete